LITGIAFGILMLELLLLPGPASALAFEGSLRSRLSANYGMDPIAARIHELRLTIVEDVLGMGDGDSSEPPAIALLMQDPVPTATLRATAVPSPKSPETDPTASPVPTDAVATETSLPAPTETLPPPTVVAASIEYCSNLSIVDMMVDDGDDVEAKVWNRGTKDVYLIKTVFEWPDVPDPAYVDYFELDHIEGEDKYHNSNDWSSPTISTIPTGRARLRGQSREDWKVDFDDEPGGKIYGSFFPTPEPTDTSTPTATPTPTTTPTPTSTDAPEPTEITPEPAETATIAPITPEPTTPIS
jgi:hypothetical protein